MIRPIALIGTSDCSWLGRWFNGFLEQSAQAFNPFTNLLWFGIREIQAQGVSAGTSGMEIGAGDEGDLEFDGFVKQLMGIDVVG